jgi:hypothetical protein
MLDLPPGRYRVYVRLPQELEAWTRLPVELELPSAHACALAALAVRPSTSVRGKVLLADGRAAEGIPVSLARPSWEWWSPFWRATALTVLTDVSGRYAFRGLQPGDYLVGFNLRHGSTEDVPYPRLMHRSATAESPLRLGAGERVTLPDVRLPSRDRYITVEGLVRRPDGTPVERVLVRTANARDAAVVSDATRTDSRGRFKVRMISGVLHWIEAVEREPRHVVARAEIEVVPNARTRPVLTLRASGSGQR